MKLPYLQFYPGDWLKDPCLTLCSPSTRGIWIDAICAMHELRSGALAGTPDQLARVLRCTLADLHAALGELKETRAADVRDGNGKVTLVNRRLVRERKARQDAAIRADRYRVSAKSRACNAKSNEKVTPYSSSSVSDSEKRNSALDADTLPRDIPPPASAGTPSKGVARPARFVAPTLAELEAYMRERRWKDVGTMAQKFHDHYAACGWVQGKGRKPIKDWRAAVRTWEGSEGGVAFDDAGVAPELVEWYQGECCVCGKTGRGKVVDGRRLEPWCAACAAGIET